VIFKATGALCIKEEVRWYRAEVGRFPWQKQVNGSLRLLGIMFFVPTIFFVRFAFSEGLDMLWRELVGTSNSAGASRLITARCRISGAAYRARSSS
jgi:hypothetical protein